MSLKSTNKVGANTHELMLEIDAKSFEDAIESVYKKEKTKITIPGFRKGKATRKMIESHYGEGVFYEQAVNSLISKELAVAVEEAKLDLVDQPAIEVMSMDRKDGVVMKATCITKPEITIENYKGIKAPKVVKDVTDEDVDNRIVSLRQKNARIVSVDDRAAQMDDEVIIDFEGFKDGVAFEGGKGDDFPLRLGSNQFIPGFEEAVVGHSIGEEFEISVTFPENYGMEELAGQPATFKINIKSISVQELPELDDEFVKDATEFDTVEELKADLKNKMQEAAEKNADVAFENKIFETIIASVNDEIPECMYDRRVNMLISEFEQSLKQQGMSIDIYLQYTGMDEESFKDTFKERSVNEVKLRLALEKVAELENLTVSDEDVEEGLTKLGEQNGMDLETVKKYVSVDSYKTDLIVSKAADLIKENAVIDNTLAEAEEAEGEE